MVLARIKASIPMHFVGALVAGLCLAAQAQAYEVQFSGDFPDKLRSKIEARSLLWQDRGAEDRPAHQLRYRLRQDQTRLQELLQSEGYFAGEIGGTVSDQAVNIVINAGPLFTLAAPILLFAEQPPQDLRLKAADIGLVEGAPAAARTVLDAKSALVDALKSRGYLAATIGCETITADHKATNLQVKWCVETGRPHILVGLRFQGLQTIDENYARNIPSVDNGVVLTPAVRNTVVEDLIATGLFEKVTLRDEIRMVDGVAETTLLVNVTEAEHRTLSAGLSYDTTRGFGGKLGWEHRNILGGGEKLAFEISGAEDGQEGRLTFLKPHFTARDRTLRLKGSYLLEKTDAYDIEKIAAGAEVDQRFSSVLTLTAGAEIDTTLEDFGATRQRFSLLTPFLAAVYDTRNSLLDPTQGVRVYARAAPSFGVIDTTGQFVTLRVGGRTYFTPGIAESIIAVRVGLASVVGGSRFDIPTDRLLFAGGGGSVRGFAYQSVGPRDADLNPLGGRSLLEGSVEWRQPVYGDYGLVVFVDAGLVGPARLPQADDRVEVGAGLGVRYQTGVGPLRFDVGLPVTRRTGDDPFQIYVSIGQAF